MKILLHDQVKILIGKDKGRQGEVIRSIPKKSQIVVKGLNLYKKHVKPNQNQKGGIIEREREILVSKVALVCPKCTKVVRVGYQVDKTGQKYRVCKKCHSLIASPTK